MTTATTTCPAWCEWQQNQNHRDGDIAADGTGSIRVHSRLVGKVTIAGHSVAADVTQEETQRGDVVERGPLLIDVGEMWPMTPAEARALAALLLNSADQLEPPGGEIPQVMPEVVAMPVKRANLRPVVVPNLGRDAVVFTHYGIVMLDAEAVASRPDDIAEWLAS